MNPSELKYLSQKSEAVLGKESMCLLQCLIMISLIVSWQRGVDVYSFVWGGVLSFLYLQQQN